jgi:hypothetical protein
MTITIQQYTYKIWSITNPKQVCIVKARRSHISDEIIIYPKKLKSNRFVTMGDVVDTLNLFFNSSNTIGDISFNRIGQWK